MGLAQFRAASGTSGAPVRPQEEGGLRGGGGPRPGRAESQVRVRQGPQSDVGIDARLFSEGQDFGSGQNWTEGERVGAGARHRLRSPARLRGRSGADRWDRDDQVSFFIRGVILLGGGRKRFCVRRKSSATFSKRMIHNQSNSVSPKYLFQHSFLWLLTKKNRDGRCLSLSCVDQEKAGYNLIENDEFRLFENLQCSS